MKPSLSVFGAGIILASIGLAGVSAAAAGKKPTLHELMTRVVSVQTQIIWDVGNNHQDEEGNIDPKKLKDADWNGAAAAALKVKTAMESLAKGESIVVAAPGQKLDDEGEGGVLGAKDVQKLIESDPKTFAEFAQTLASAMDETIAAAKSRNPAKLAQVSGDLDQICESCHRTYWYPPQK